MEERELLPATPHRLQDPGSFAKSAPGELLLESVHPVVTEGVLFSEAVLGQRLAEVDTDSRAGITHGFRLFQRTSFPLAGRQRCRKELTGVGCN